jgi:osmoprotectant transport system substrate-binding protein
MKKTLFTLLLISILALVGCGKEKKEVIKIGHKNFTEQRILGEMLSIMIEKNTDYETEVKELGGTMLVNQGLLSGDIDISMEYTGTGYLYILKASGLKDPDAIYNYVKTEFAKKGITWLNPLGFNNTYAFAVKPETAEKYNLEKVSDFVGVAQDLSVGEIGDFFSREDGMPGISKTYGFDFGKEVNLDTGLKYVAINQDEIDVAVVYTTDGMLKKYNLVVLDDDKNFFPPYDSVPRMKTEFADAHPAIVTELEKFGSQFSDEDFQNYNYLVDVMEYPIKKVAEDALREKGLIK